MNLLNKIAFNNSGASTLYTIVNVHSCSPLVYHFIPGGVPQSFPFKNKKIINLF